MTNPHGDPIDVRFEPDHETPTLRGMPMLTWQWHPEHRRHGWWLCYDEPYVGDYFIVGEGPMDLDWAVGRAQDHMQWVRDTFEGDDGQ